MGASKCGKKGTTHTAPVATTKAGTKPPKPVTKATTPKACACPKILKPVCGKDGKTYSNACLAKCADVDVDTHVPASECGKKGQGGLRLKSKKFYIDGVSLDDYIAQEVAKQVA